MAKGVLLGLALGLLVAVIGHIVGGTPTRIMTTVLAGAIIGGAIAWAMTAFPSEQRGEAIHCGPYCLDTNHPVPGEERGGDGASLCPPRGPRRRLSTFLRRTTNQHEHRYNHDEG